MGLEFFHLSKEVLIFLGNLFELWGNVIVTWGRSHVDWLDVFRHLLWLRFRLELKDKHIEGLVLVLQFNNLSPKFMSVAIFLFVITFQSLGSLHCDLGFLHELVHLFDEVLEMEFLFVTHLQPGR